MASITYIPLLLTKPGVISVDTKQYLYLNPSGYLNQVASIWTSKVDMGTVTHQNIGYLLPMGEWYSFFSFLHVPVWIAQRLWSASIFFSAGAGTYYFSKTLKLSTAGATVAGTVYMLSPYMLQYIEHISALLLPVAALGWMMGFTVNALRSRKNIYSLLFGITVALSSTINATSFGYIAVGPVLVLIFLLLYKETTIKRALLIAFQFLSISILVSLYWIEALIVEGKYGLNILKTTESLTAISSTSSPSEIFRGIGYWYFYSIDSYGFVIPTSVKYQTQHWLIIISFLIPAIAFCGFAITKWRYKSLSVALMLFGFIVSVGIYPITNKTYFGSKFYNLLQGSELGLALRSSTRATPVYIIGSAIIIGACVSALNFRYRKIEKLLMACIVLLAIFNIPGLFNGSTVNLNMARENIPSYWYQASNYLSQNRTDTRIIQEPGQNFDSYTFGTTNDSLLAGLTTRPTVERHQVAMGSTYGVNLLDNFDNSFQRSDLNPSGLSAMLRLMSAGDMLITNDEMYSLYQIPPPAAVNSMLTPLPTGLGKPIGFGKPVANYPPYGLPYYNNQTLAIPETAPTKLPPLVDIPVKNARPIVRLESPTAPVIIDGDGLGVMEAANAGLLNGNPTIYYSGTYANNPKQLKSLLTKDATLVVTDTNRKQLKDWTSFIDQSSEIETAAQKNTSASQNLFYFNIFPNTSTSMQSVAVDQGVKSITASVSNNVFEFNPQSKPFNAFDGNYNTSWTTSPFENPIGAWIQVKLLSPVNTNKITLTQALNISQSIWISKASVTLKLNNKVVRTMTVDLGQESRQQPGQTFKFPSTRFNSMRIEILQTYSPSGFTVLPVGFSKININNIISKEIIRPPTDLISNLGNATSNYRLVYIFGRSMVGSLAPRSSPEVNISRYLDTPTKRTFQIAGDATLSTQITDEQISSIVSGVNPSTTPVPYFSSSSRLGGDNNAYGVNSQGSSLNSAWQTSTGLNNQLGAWLQINNPTSITFNQIILSFYADGHHSIPSFVTVSTEEGQRKIPIPANIPIESKSNLETVLLRFPPLSGRNIRLTVQAIKPVEGSLDFGPNFETLPIAIHNYRLQYSPGVNQVSSSILVQNSKLQSSQNLLSNLNIPNLLPNSCQNDLASVDGSPIWLKLVGTSTAALNGKYIQFVGCGPDAKGLTLGAGTHILETSLGVNSGIKIDQIEFNSPAPTSHTTLSAQNIGFIPKAPTPNSKAKIKTLGESDTNLKLQVTTTGKPVWLVLGENYDSGWSATISSQNGHLAKMAAKSSLIDAYANGWLINPPKGTNTYIINLSFTPQTAVNLAIYLSFGTLSLSLIGIIFLVYYYRRRKRSSVAYRTVDYGSEAGAIPKLSNPFFYSRGRSSLILSLITSIAFYYFSSALLNKFDGVALATLLFVLSQVRYLKFIGSIGTAALVVYAGLTIASLQKIHDYAPGVFWPSTFNKQSHLIYIAVIMLSMQSLIDYLRSKRIKT